MSVFAYTHYDYIGRIGFKQFAVSFRLFFGVFRRNIYVIHAFERTKPEYMSL